MPRVVPLAETVEMYVPHAACCVAASASVYAPFVHRDSSGQGRNARPLPDRPRSAVVNFAITAACGIGDDPPEAPFHFVTLAGKKATLAELPSRGVIVS